MREEKSGVDSVVYRRHTLNVCDGHVTHTMRPTSSSKNSIGDNYMFVYDPVTNNYKPRE